MTHKQQDEAHQRRLVEAEKIVPLLQELIACPEVADLIEDVVICHSYSEVDGERLSTLRLTKRGLVHHFNRDAPVTDLMECVMSFAHLHDFTVRKLIANLRGLPGAEFPQLPAQ
ncbi:MAG: hypothetical protein AAB365_03210 [Patescibacteria group bacterium]